MIESLHLKVGDIPKLQGRECWVLIIPRVVGSSPTAATNPINDFRRIGACCSRQRLLNLFRALL